MVIEKINELKQVLENQISQADSYDKIYETSVKIDELLIDYYNEYKLIEKSN